MKYYRPLLLCIAIITASWSPAYGQLDAPEPDTPEISRPSEISAWQAALIGAVEGITEYLPVSSTGHIILTQRAMGIGDSEDEKAAADAYAIVIQAGAILAVLGLYFQHVRRMVLGLFGKDAEGRTLLINLIVAFMPAVVIGLLFNDLIKKVLFGMWPTVIAWIVGGIVILVLERKAFKDHKSDLDIYSMSWKKALTIGFIQCIAMWPGTSRSLATILGGRLVGLNLKQSVIFSFILGMVTLSASTAYDGLKHGELILEKFGAASLLIGLVVAFVSAVLAVKWLVRYLSTHSMAIFGYYRIALGVIVALLLGFGLLPS